MGNAVAAAIAGPAKSPSGGASLYWVFIIVLVLFGGYFLLTRRQRNQQRQIMEQQRGITPGQRVRTTAGMYATVAAVDGDDVVLEVAPDIEVRYMKRAIIEVLGDAGAGGETGDEPEEASDSAEEPEPGYEDEAADDDAGADADPADGEAADPEDTEADGHAGHPVKVAGPEGTTAQG